MHSPPHRDNILAPEAVELGCGAAFFRDGQGFPKFKLVQVFQWYEPVQSRRTASRTAYRSLLSLQHASR
jgi:hypothetical protein